MAAAVTGIVIQSYMTSLLGASGDIAVPSLIVAAEAGLRLLAMFTMYRLSKK